MAQRRERTRHLIELGGLVVKAGIVDLVDDDRAVIFGALLEVRRSLESERHDELVLLWRRAGRRAFGIHSVE
ncbi:MAG TPA: conjugal transfer protein TraD [Allosphingosinicella sp.]|nr:conjugal transfer protein TraD [Allosphingosinicella sp.]